ncbi:MAG: hypothetical protein OIN85_10115 [Candidatus Methanoperedens sp.]|nr:hypothetical protein [Candidatus Methanoperedens sp.]
MAGNRTYILIIILSAVFAVAFFALPNAPSSGAFAKCSACHPQQTDELKRAPFHTSMQCTDCHELGSFRQDLRSHNATTPTCTGCHGGLHEIIYKKPLDHTSFI